MTTARKLRLAADRAYTLEFCKCGQHPRIMSVAAMAILLGRPR